MSKKFTDIIKEASSCIRKFESESAQLNEKIAKLEAELISKAKESEANKIAMVLILDDDVIKDINDKTAALKDEDLNVVKKALELDLTKKLASLGEVEKSKGSDSGLTPRELFNKSILSLKS